MHFNITNINEAPTEIDIDYNMTVKEHSPVGAFVANMTVLDPDTNQTHTCYLVNGQQEFMLVNATITGEEEITMEVSIVTVYFHAVQEKSRISVGAPRDLSRGGRTSGEGGLRVLGA